MQPLADAARALFSQRGRPVAAPKREPMSCFGRRLHDEPAGLQLSACLNFLLYWFARGDTRPDPHVEAMLLAMDPDTLDLREAGKRAAWSEDVYAFADTVHRVIDITAPDQRIQFLDLLLVVRFCEGERGASENVLVRFLGDAFGMRMAELTRRYERACGAPLEPMPRLYPDDWWLRHSDEDGFAPCTDDELQRRRRLGLVLRGPILEVAITAGFEQRSMLVDPKRFDRLGRQERRLAERLRARLVEARDDLLEASR